jgi:CDP-paratose 2-epimerase
MRTGSNRAHARANGGAHDGDDRPVLITGGAGFVGCNLAHRLLGDGRRVVLLDNLSRPGVERNLRWLLDTHGSAVQADVSDIRDAGAVARAVADASHVFHFAAQVAVTTSLTDPVEDFDVNARGTLNVLEALRAQRRPPPLLFTSTNKVYGGLYDVPLACDGARYEPESPTLRATGIGESRPLDFHSPYGCSKGTADQYVLDYARSFGLRTTVFRMSCIYGPHQFGTEDQGWVAHFLIRAIEGRPIILYGDGMQVRDVLFVDDLVDAFGLAMRNADALAGRAFNIGGGPANTTSLLELLGLIAAEQGDRPEVRFEEWRTGDQRYYVSDTRAFTAATGWTPRVGVREGVAALYRWLVEQRAGAATVESPMDASAATAGASAGGGRS